MLGLKIIVAVMSSLVLYLMIDNYRLGKEIELLKSSAEKAMRAQARLNEVTGIFIRDLQDKLRKDKKDEVD